MAGEELCQECGARVASIKMKIHMRVNHDKEEKKCKDCNLVCVGKKSFYNHMRNHIKSSCKYCSQDISKSQLSQHMKICTKNENVQAYKCELCPFESAFKYKVKSHHDSFHVNVKQEPKEYKKKNPEHHCPICRKVFKSNKLLKQHSRSHEVKKSECSLCKKLFSSQQALTVHMNMLHKAKIIESSQGFGLWEEPEIKKKQLDLICDSCGYTTTIKTNFKKHKLTHEKVKKDKLTGCDKCDYTSTKEANVKRHKQNFKHVEKESRATKYRKLKALKKEVDNKLKKRKRSSQGFW
jgi:hypothetical protein